MPERDNPTHSPATLPQAGTVDRCLPASTVQNSTCSPERYQLREEIARGGMGAVYLATDTTLGREVAVKVLQERFDLESSVARRFFDEARISAQLQHPGIPPVHDLGTLPDGRPFLAMKLIKGRTLDELLKDRTDPSDERGRYLAAFEQICQAIAYAHSHKVIHRDLKPANVMVGSFGEVQVMDWGLAKVLTGVERGGGDPEETGPGTEVRSFRDDNPFTQTGSVLGTLAFMPPEQALGAIGKIDARSDVFGLGAILAVILTGKPPFATGSVETTRIQAAQGKLDDCFARLDASGAEPEWVALCKRCLSPNSADRPPDGEAVARSAAELRQAADERARRAEVDREKAELRGAEQRKRRRVQLLLAVAVALILLSGGAFAWWRADQSRVAEARLNRNAEALGVLLDQGEEALRRIDPERAAVLLDTASNRFEERGADHPSLAKRLESLRSALSLFRQLDEIDRFRWTDDPYGRYPDAKSVMVRFQQCLGSLGLDPECSPPEEIASRLAHSPVRDRVLFGLDWILGASKSERCRFALRLIDSDPYRDLVRDAYLAGNPSKLVELLSRPEAHQQAPDFLSISALFAGSRERQQELLKAVVNRRPNDVGLLMTLGLLSRDGMRRIPPDGVRWFQAAVAAAPRNPVTHNKLGTALSDVNDTPGAESAFREAIRLDPKYSAARHNLAMLLWEKKNDTAGAEQLYRECILVNPEDLGALANLAVLLEARNDLRGAEAALRDVLRIAPNNPGILHQLGNLLFEIDPAEAEVAFREAIRIDPKMASAHNNLGYLCQIRGDFDQAINEYKETLKIDSKHELALARLPQAEGGRFLQRRLTDVLAKRAKTMGPAEDILLAQFCMESFQHRYRAAVHFYEKAFAADAKRASDPVQQPRYNASCAAALASSGKGIDPPTETKECAALRAKALAWLLADLAHWKDLAGSSNPTNRKLVTSTLTHWLQDPDLASLRPGLARMGMPFDEAKIWDAFWGEVKATLAEAQQPPKPELLPVPKER